MTALRAREDKDATMAKLEKPAQASGKPVTVLGVRITHPERVVFPDAGCTKGDVAAYYAKAADRMLEHAGHRPVSLLRCPEGINGECFFQKHTGKGFPSGIARVDIEEKSGKSEPYMVIEERQGFAAAAQMGTIEFHIWGSRTDMLEAPDRVVFDIDPDEGLPFSGVKAAASDVRKLLEDVGLQSLPMVTGGKGVHVVIEIRRTVGWDTVKLFAHTVASHMAETEPERFVANMAKARRAGRIFVDYLRNERGATAVAPFSVRARPGASVAFPLDWDALAGAPAANAWTMERALAEGDWAAVGVPKPVSLEAAVKRMAKAWG